MTGTSRSAASEWLASSMDDPGTLEQVTQQLRNRRAVLRLLEADLGRARTELDGLRTETTTVIEQGEALLVRIPRNMPRRLPG